MRFIVVGVATMASRDEEFNRAIRDAANTPVAKSPEVLSREARERERGLVEYLGHVSEEQLRTQVRMRGELYKG